MSLESQTSMYKSISTNTCSVFKNKPVSNKNSYSNYYSSLAFNIIQLLPHCYTHTESEGLLPGKGILFAVASWTVRWALVRFHFGVLENPAWPQHHGKVHYHRNWGWSTRQWGWSMGQRRNRETEDLPYSASGACLGKVMVPNHVLPLCPQQLGSYFPFRPSSGPADAQSAPQRMERCPASGRGGLHSIPRCCQRSQSWGPQKALQRCVLEWVTNCPRSICYLWFCGLGRIGPYHPANGPSDFWGTGQHEIRPRRSFCTSGKCV